MTSNILHVVLCKRGKTFPNLTRRHTIRKLPSWFNDSGSPTTQRSKAAAAAADRLSAIHLRQTTATSHNATREKIQVKDKFLVSMSYLETGFYTAAGPGPIIFLHNVHYFFALLEGVLC